MSTGDAFTASDHVTEREPGPWRDCTFASFLEVMRDGFTDGRDIPATMVEKEALRAAAGLPDDHTGATIAQGIAACRERYGLAGGYAVTGDWAIVRAALSSADKRLVVQGSMGSVTTWLRRWQPTFSGAHAVAARGLVWCDPLAPKGTYAGELVEIGTWESYFRGLAGAQAFITTAGGLTRSDMPIYERRPLTGRFTIPANKAVNGYKPVGSDWQVVKTWPPRPTPSSGPFDGLYVRIAGTTTPSALVYVTEGYFAGLYVPTSAVDEVYDPDATPYTQADLDAAYERGKAEGDQKQTVTLSIGGQPAYTTEV